MCDDPVSWIQEQGVVQRGAVDAVQLGIDFLSTAWHIWKARNTWIFEGTVTPAFGVAVQASTYSRCTMEALLRDSMLYQPRQGRLVSWVAPPSGVLKLNTDGSRRHSTGLATAGGLLRDSSGTWLAGFSVNIGQAPSYLAELWGLFFGLQLCTKRHVQDLIVELDSMSIVQQLEQERGFRDSTAPRILSALFLDCLQLISLIPNISIVHTLREGNAPADFLANHGHELPPGYHEFDCPPLGLSTLLMGDSLGISFPRL